jgi:hypothetical protein
MLPENRLLKKQINEGLTKNELGALYPFSEQRA